MKPKWVIRTGTTGTGSIHCWRTALADGDGIIMGVISGERVAGLVSHCEVQVASVFQPPELDRVVQNIEL